ncbi:MAG TPA: flagellar biosynthetic protein FliO [Bryobacteraceae bacterium]
MEQLSAVIIVLGLLCGSLWLLKRKGWARTSFRRAARPGQPRLEVLDRLSLTPQHSLHLVRVADRTLLVGLSPQGCNLLESGPSAAMSVAGLEN